MAAEVCARCARSVPAKGKRWPEGFVCRRCYQRATRRRGTCPSCRQERLLPGQRGDEPVCSTCAGLPEDFRCTRCGEEDEPYRKGLCSRCCLRDDLAQLLDDGCGQVRAELVAFYDAACSQPDSRSARIWLRNPTVLRLLRGFADGSLPLEHATFDAEAARRTAVHLEGLFTRCGIRPERDPTITTFEHWLGQKLAGPIHPDDRALLHRFATWHHLRRMRVRAAAGTLKPGAANSAKQEITVAAEFLAFLRGRGIAPTALSPQAIDQWLAPGPSTRYTARSFARWAIRHGHMSPVDFPRRKART